AGKLPRAQVPGNDEHSLAARFGSKKMLQTFSANPVAGVGFRVAMHAAELDQLPAEMAIDAAQNLRFFLCGDFREGQFQVALTHAPQPAIAAVDHQDKQAGSKA